tara:strand:- start:74 stop:409 length:336 start_codon:yes stop_codon:yes gene_type:complete
MLFVSLLPSVYLGLYQSDHRMLHLLISNYRENYMPKLRDDLTVFADGGGLIYRGEHFTDEEKAEAIELVRQHKKTSDLLGVPCNLHISDEIAALEALYERRMQDNSLPKAG